MFVRAAHRGPPVYRLYGRLKKKGAASQITDRHRGLPLRPLLSAVTHIVGAVTHIVGATSCRPYETFEDVCSGFAGCQTQGFFKLSVRSLRKGKGIGNFNVRGHALAFQTLTVYLTIRNSQIKQRSIRKQKRPSP